jgi:glycosyltransferase involved in cell wall biosynthesis
MNPVDLHAFNPPEDLDRRAAYEALVRGEHATGPAGTVVFAVYTLNLGSGRGDLPVAAGLGLALVERGYGVTLMPRGKWHLAPDADVFVAMLPEVDPALGGPNAWKVAWVRNETERWSRMPSLHGYDQVIASSRLSAQRLGRELPTVPDVLPIGADVDLFLPPEDEGIRTPSAVASANHWGSMRSIHDALSVLPDDADVVWYGRYKGDAPKLKRWHHSAVSYFRLPAVYQRATLVIDDLNKTTLGFGSVNSRFFESAACGALPVVNGVLGFADLGFDDLPVYRDPQDLRSVLAELRADPEGTARRARALRDKVRAEHSWQVRAASFVASVERARAPGSIRSVGTPLHFFPDYTVTNPYQTMLYSDLGKLDAYPMRVGGRLTTHLRAEAESGRPGTVHVHWTSPILQWAGGPFRAYRILRDLTTALDAFKAAGGRLVWTIHNVLPHDGHHLWAEERLAELLADRADLIHVLSPSTLEATAQHYVLDPAKVVVVEHSSYRGIYPDWITRAAARAQLDLLPEEKVLIALGGIRPYKGLDRLLDLFDRLAAEDPAVRLLIAGKPGRFAGIEELQERCEADPRIVAEFEHLPEDRLQVWMKAADLAVMPYRSVLNSGAALLAQGFGLPLVGPRSGALAELEGEGHIRLFDPRDDASFEATVREGLRDLVERPDTAAAARASATAYADRLPPARMAAEFAAVVAPLLQPHVEPGSSAS